MIISHKLKIIYIKLRKVAGTSFEVALSRYCSADDILTPPEKKTGKNKSLVKQGYSGARNYEMFDIANNIAHLGAKEIKPIISADIFDNYLKIATMRNPYQKAISWYFWKKRAEEPIVVGKDFKDFIVYEYFHRGKKQLMDYDLMHIKGKSVVDFVLRYEHLAEDIKKLEIKIGCPGLSEAFTNIHVKADIRPAQGNSLYEVYSKYPKVKLIIDRIHFENMDKYELLRKYWPIYKSEMENILSNSS